MVLSSCFSIMSLGFLVILLSCFASQRSHACNQLDHDHLLSFFLNISSPHTNLNWSNTDCCPWEGISCDWDGRVTHLWLPFRGLGGNLSSSFGNLTRLSHVNFSHNWISGPLPKEFLSFLQRLETLDLSYNLLSDELQSSLSVISLPFSIRAIDLSSNKFQGMVGSSFLGVALDLICCNLSNNSFTGQLPSSICNNSPFIKLLDFSFNDFIGQIPHGFGRCSKLEVFRAGFNSLSGLLPYDIYNVTTLQQISLPSNKLSRHIGDGIVQLSNLTILELYSNELTGDLPKDIGNLSHLEQLNLQFNNLGGALPPSLMNCTNLITLNLWSNFFRGDISALNFSKLQQLRVLDLGVNQFSGKLPTSIYSCKSLAAIRLAGNQLNGQISPAMLVMKSLSFLSLAGNRLVNITEAVRILMGCKSLRIAILGRNFFNEIMPDHNSIVNFVGFKNLELLSLFGCQLTGRVPSWLPKLKKLAVLDLKRNQLIGSIPGSLGALPRLFYLDLSENLLSGEFPKEICRLPALTSQKARAEINKSYMLLPIFGSPTNSMKYCQQYCRQYRSLAYLPPSIKLGNNNLNGHIPIEIGQLQLVQELNLSDNYFSGNIPIQISDLTNMEKLDLSMNHLDGEIPVSLGKLHFLSSFNIAYNNLQGQIPSGSQLDLFDASSYMGNPKLCGIQLPNVCRITDGNSTDIQQVEDEHKIPWFKVVVGVGYATGFWAVCITLCLKNSWRHAYFQFLNEINDKVFVKTGANMARLWRSL